MKLIDAFKQFLLEQKSPASPATVKNYLADIRKFVLWFEERFSKQFTPQDVTVKTVEEFKASISQAEGSAKSIERYGSSLRKFFRFLKLEGVIALDPFETQAQPQNDDPLHLKSFKNFLYVYNASTLTIKNYLIDIRQFFTWAQTVFEESTTNEPLLSLISPAVVEEYKERLLEENVYSPTSINRKLSSLRKYFAWAIEQGIVTRNPFEVAQSHNNPLDLEAVLAMDISGKILEKQPEHIEVPQRVYSVIPPVRLIQKGLSALDFLMDKIIVTPISQALNSARLFVWNAQGKPVFTRPSLGVALKAGQKAVRATT
ncbi:MAG: site-specific integrase, partial [Patescibacteria group bacterium]|nr:site-specific integrase [Patescibacteria group bacterium]